MTETPAAVDEFPRHGPSHRGSALPRETAVVDVDEEFSEAERARPRVAGSGWSTDRTSPYRPGKDSVTGRRNEAGGLGEAVGLKMATDSGSCSERARL
jgi:hypothetical protein